MSINFLGLPNEQGRHFYYRPKVLEETSIELADFLNDVTQMNTLKFARKVMFSHEIKANNQVEGYYDDVKTIEEVIKSIDHIKDDYRRKRILNLFKGYNYILKGQDINPDTLKELYSTLSDGLIDEDLVTKMGDKYRINPVYILQGGRLDSKIENGVNAENIERLMEHYFQLQNLPSNNPIDDYIISQIMHFYFVYIHPYYDTNGRTSRTLAMWHLLNKKAYPFIIFNRGISLKGRAYDKIINRATHTMDMTLFLEYMLDTVKVELEKEYVMEMLASSAKMSAQDYQTLLYFLTINGLKTVKDFAAIYNRFNDKKPISEIFNEMIQPLIDKCILKVVRQTSRYMYENKPNLVLELNSKKLDIDPQKIRRLELK